MLVPERPEAPVRLPEGVPISAPEPVTRVPPEPVTTATTPPEPVNTAPSPPEPTPVQIEVRLLQATRAQREEFTWVDVDDDDPMDTNADFIHNLLSQAINKVDSVYASVRPNTNGSPNTFK